MNRTEFMFSEEPSGFLEVSSMQPRSLHQLFTDDSSDLLSTWDFSSHEIEPLSEESPISDFVLKKELFKKIKKGTQEDNSGEIDVSLAKTYCESLNDLSSQTHAAFSKDRLQNPLSGGTCSAMSLEFANDYLNTQSTISFKIDGDHLSKNPQPSPKQIFDAIGDKYKASSKYFRTIQSTFNTIHKDAKHPSDDFMLDKISSLLKFYDRQVTASSETFYIEMGLDEEVKGAKEKILSFLSETSEGVFVIRCILFDNNDKGEAYGHTTILIREQGENYFFDPNEGIFELGEDSKAVVDILKPMMQKWGIPFGRIYKIQ